MNTVLLIDVFEPTPWAVFAERLPGLADRAAERDPDAVGKPIPWRVFATRSMALDVAARLPDGPVILDLEGASVLSTPFVREMLKVRPDVMPANANDDVAEAWAMATERP